MTRLRLIQGGREEEAADGELSFSGFARKVERPAGRDMPALCADQRLRKQWAEELLRADNVPIDPDLPVIAGEAMLRLRSPAEVVDRTLALAIVAAKAAGLPEGEVQRIIDELAADGLFTPCEQDFIDTPAPGKDERRVFASRYEAAWILLWALRHIDDPLGRPDVTCDPDRLTDTIFDAPDLARHGLRTANRILNEADLTHRLHWATSQARLAGETPPAGLLSEVVAERHHALTWLTCQDADWDALTAAR